MKKLMILFVLLFVTPLYATVSTGESIRRYFSPDGASTTFTFTQPCNSSDDILVFKQLESTGEETSLVEDTDYTIAPTGGDYLNGGVVTIDPAMAATFQLVVVREIQKSQETTSGAITPVSIVDALDRLARTVQDLEDRNDRSWHLQESDSASFDMEIPGLDGRAETFPFFDADGNLTYVSDVIADSIAASAFGTSLVQAATASAGRDVLEMGTTDAVEFAAITGTTGTFTGAVGITGAVTASGNVTMASAKVLTTEIIRAVDSTGILIQNDTPATIITIEDASATATLADSSQMASSAAPTTDADIANKKYVDDQITAAIAASVSLSSYTNQDSESNSMLPTAGAATHAYLAASDGFVSAVTEDLDDGVILAGYVDQTNDPVGAGDLIATVESSAANNHNSIFFAVADGEYFEVSCTADVTINIRWISMGPLAEPVDQD